MRRVLAVSSALVVAAVVVAVFGSPVAATPPGPPDGASDGRPVGPALAGSAAWNVDANHTEVNFSVNHFFTPVTGSFRDFEVGLNYDPDDPSASSVEARIAVASVDTGNERRDDHLRSPDFFAAEEHPYITFESTSVERVADDRLVARGPLTIRGVSREVELPITILGTKAIPAEMKEMLGDIDEVASFEASTTLDRGDFGVGTGSWAATLVVGGQVDIEILVEANR